MTSSAPARANGVLPVVPIAKHGPRLPGELISASAATASGSGTAADETNQPSKPSSGKAAKPSSDRQSKKAIQRARTVIAVSLETIDEALHKMGPVDRILALTEVIRRATRRLETEGVKIMEALDEDNDE